jgi:hypothetical protein
MTRRLGGNARIPTRVERLKDLSSCMAVEGRASERLQVFSLDEAGQSTPCYSRLG